MLVSVVIPTHNRRELLRSALESVYKQTYSRFEVIVVDDCSTDGTTELLRQEAEQGRLRFHRNAKSLGGAGSRNVGIGLAKGELVAFLDDDDEWLPEKLAQQVPLFSDPEVGLVYCGVELVFPELGIRYDTNPRVRGYCFEEMIIENRVGGTCGVMLRADVFDSHRFDPEMPARQDYDLWLRVSRGWKIDGVQAPLLRAYSRNIKRITSDISNYERAVEAINLKHQDYIARLPEGRRRLRSSEQYFFLGAQALKANNARAARGYFFRSAIARWNVRAAGAFFASLLGVRFALYVRRSTQRGKL